MRKLLLILVVLPACTVFGQQRKHVQHIGWRGSNIELHSISDKSKQQVCSVLLKYDSIRGFLLTGNIEYQQSFTLPRKPNENMLGGFFRDGKIFLFLDNGGEDGLHCWTIDPTTGSALENIIPFDLKREKIIDRISCGDHFLYFTANKKTSEFIIHDFTSESKFTTTRHAFDEGWWQDLTRARGFSRAIDVEKIDFEGDCSVEVAATSNKIYVRNDSLFLLMNAQNGITRIFSFDLPGQTVAQRTVTHAVPAMTPGKPGAFADNSYLLKDKLYYVYATLDSLGLEVIDFNTGKTLRSYRTGRGEDIPFKNTALMQEGGAYSSNAKRELDKTRQLLRKMVTGDAVVVATLNSKGQVALTIGSYKKISTGGGGGRWTTAGVGSPGNVPTMVYIPTGGFARSAWTKSAYFKMLMDADTHEHVEGNMGASINEKIEQYTKGLKIPMEAENLFVYNGAYYYAYYNKEERKLSLVQF
ncbi:MAG TPA: hypothetical protein VD993_00390 [Chitinophagaceae bacterium]|nr:hypothetical protein [Chitinophagaceae bacterium]